MLMDEPFGAVDPIVRDRLQNEFLRLQETIAKTILFVTHDIDEAIKMGDLVAVFQTGGILAQFGPPLEILAAPASEFVARFVGQDRGLKRLSLLRVSDVPLQPAVTARPGDSAEDARRRALDDPQRYLLVIDESNRPLGWVGHGDIPADGTITPSMANPVSPTVNKRTTLKDALSMMLDADVQTGIVVDRNGAVQGLLTVAAVAAKMREGEHAPAFDALGGAETAEAEGGTDGAAVRNRHDIAAAMPRAEPRDGRRDALHEVREALAARRTLVGGGEPEGVGAHLALGVECLAVQALPFAQVLFGQGADLDRFDALKTLRRRGQDRRGRLLGAQQVAGEPHRIAR
jgi:osmoprotectant transport system ATP-binding protein